MGRIYGVIERAGDLYVQGEARSSGEELSLEFGEQFSREQMQQDPRRLRALERWERGDDEAEFIAARWRETELQDWDAELTDAFLATASLDEIESWGVHLDGWDPGPEARKRALSCLRDQRREKLHAV